MSRKIVPKDADIIREAADIVINAESDEAAVEFLRDTLKDDYPDLDLGKMDLHEAVKVLGEKDGKAKGKGDMKAIENLNKALGDFIDKQEANLSKTKVKRKKKTRKTRRKTKKK